MWCKRCNKVTITPESPVCVDCQELIVLEWIIKANEVETLCISSKFQGLVGSITVQATEQPMDMDRDPSPAGGEPPYGRLYTSVGSGLNRLAKLEDEVEWELG